MNTSGIIEAAIAMLKGEPHDCGVFVKISTFLPAEHLANSLKGHDFEISISLKDGEYSATASVVLASMELETVPPETRAIAAIFADTLEALSAKTGCLLAALPPACNGHSIGFHIGNFASYERSGGEVLTGRRSSFLKRMRHCAGGARSLNPQLWDFAAETTQRAAGRKSSGDRDARFSLRFYGTGADNCKAVYITVTPACQGIQGFFRKSPDITTATPVDRGFSVSIEDCILHPWTKRVLRAAQIEEVGPQIAEYLCKSHLDAPAFDVSYYLRCRADASLA
jgi:hypothetical protein